MGAGRGSSTGSFFSSTGGGGGGGGSLGTISFTGLGGWSIRQSGSQKGSQSYSMPLKMRMGAGGDFFSMIGGGGGGADFFGGGGGG